MNESMEMWRVLRDGALEKNEPQSQRPIERTPVRERRGVGQSPEVHGEYQNEII
jgi:hypothetical protein